MFVLSALFCIYKILPPSDAYYNVFRDVWSLRNGNLDRFDIDNNAEADQMELLAPDFDNGGVILLHLRRIVVWTAWTAAMDVVFVDCHSIYRDWCSVLH